MRSNIGTEQREYNEAIESKRGRTSHSTAIEWEVIEYYVYVIYRLNQITFFLYTFPICYEEQYSQISLFSLLADGQQYSFTSNENNRQAQFRRLRHSHPNQCNLRINSCTTALRRQCLFNLLQPDPFRCVYAPKYCSLNLSPPNSANSIENWILGDDKHGSSHTWVIRKRAYLRGSGLPSEGLYSAPAPKYVTTHKIAQYLNLSRLLDSFGMLSLAIIPLTFLWLLFE